MCKFSNKVMFVFFVLFGSMGYLFGAQEIEQKIAYKEIQLQVCFNLFEQYYNQLLALDDDDVACYYINIEITKIMKVMITHIMLSPDFLDQFKLSHKKLILIQKKIKEIVFKWRNFLDSFCRFKDAEHEIFFLKDKKKKKKAFKDQKRKALVFEKIKFSHDENMLIEKAKINLIEYITARGIQL